MQRTFLEDGLLFLSPTAPRDVRYIEDSLKAVKINWSRGNIILSEAGGWAYSCGRTLPQIPKEGSPEGQAERGLSAQPSILAAPRSGKSQSPAPDPKGTQATPSIGLIPVSQRLLTVFLYKLGRGAPTGPTGMTLQTRKAVIESKDLVPIIPKSIQLSTFSLTEADSKTGRNPISVSARDVEENLSRDKSMDISQFAKAPMLYGREVFVVTVEELRHLVSTRRLVTSEALPKSFFAAISFLFHDPDFVQYTYVHQTVPLEKFGTGSNVVDSSLAEAMETLQNLVLSDVPSEDPSDILGAISGVSALRWRWMLQELKSRTLYRNSLEKAELEKRLEKLIQTMVECVKSSEDCGGFLPGTVSEELSKTLALTPVEIAEHVSLSVKAYFFVGSVGKYTNQISEKVGEPVTVIFGKLIDFSNLEEVARLLSKPVNPELMSETSAGLSTTTGTSAAQHGGLKRSSEVLLYRRFQRIFTLMLRSAQLQGCRTIVFQPMVDATTSPYLSHLSPGVLSSIVSIHFQAFYDTLQENWGLDSCFVCGTRYHSWAITTLSSKAYTFPCHVVIEEKDSKHLAVALARQLKKVGLFCPADFWTLLGGRIGGYWESENVAASANANNPTLVDVAATSTVPLASLHTLKEDWTLSQICDQSDVTGINKWLEVALPLDYEHFKQFRRK